MKYNKSYNNKNFELYISYLLGIRNKLSKELYDFVSNPNRHNFSEESLHDSWLKNVEINTDFEKRTSNILIRLLGAYHDREFVLQFKGVRHYKIAQELQDGGRDLITFEIGNESNCYDEEQIFFRAEFAGEDNEIEIFCNELNVEENINRK